MAHGLRDGLEIDEEPFTAAVSDSMIVGGDGRQREKSEADETNDDGHDEDGDQRKRS